MDFAKIPADSEHLSEIDRLSFPGAYNASKYYARSKDTYLVKRNKTSRVVAFIQLRKIKEEKKIWIHLLAVHPEYRRQKLGTQLISDAEVFAKHAGYSAIYLSVLEDNLSARKLYKKCGFEPVENSMNCLIKKLI
jgi:ribosomal protein S18 acetylase RimI-like enzyme